MDFYFSGVSSQAERTLLEAAGVARVLVDPTDLANVAGWPGQVALDCGAYRRHRGGRSVSFREYVAIAERGGFAFVTAYDVIGDQARSRRYWREMCALGLSAVPVYHWGARRSVLLRYLDEAPLVGIGGMVNILRAKGQSKEETKALERARDVAANDLGELCSTYPNRLHLFGGCWLRALERLRGVLASADSSKWLDGRRYRLHIFEHSRTNHLSIAPARALGLGDWDGDRISIENARNMEHYLMSGSRMGAAA